MFQGTYPSSADDGEDRHENAEHDVGETRTRGSGEQDSTIPRE